MHARGDRVDRIRRVAAESGLSVATTVDLALGEFLKRVEKRLGRRIEPMHEQSDDAVVDAIREALGDDSELLAELKDAL